jgi:hypothetical protein
VRTALLVLLLALILGVLGLAAHLVWWFAVGALVLWMMFVRNGGGRHGRRHRR